jgi:arsenate reductase-like glutaredoxin family protein
MTDKFLTEKDVDYLEKRLRDTFVTKAEFMEYKSELFDKLDEIIKNTRDTKEEVDLVENRVTKIESNLSP